jgi:aldehyde:ferredoxin oxidoreductase
MAGIYRVNMSDLSVRFEEPGESYRGLGGRALTSAIVADEVPPTCHPLSAENRLVLAPGLLTGTGAPCSGRLSAGAKSPLTRTIKESNSGGMAAIHLSMCGIQALVIEGQPEPGKQYRLIVTPQGVSIEPVDDLAGLGNYDTVARQYERFGTSVSCISIGPAGEMRLPAASIAVTDIEGRPTRHCGRGGLGAVMGSKGIKVIVVNPSGGQRPRPVDNETVQAGGRTLQYGADGASVERRSAAQVRHQRAGQCSECRGRLSDAKFQSRAPSRESSRSAANISTT